MTELKHPLRKIADSLLRWVFPPSCIVCDEPLSSDRLICLSCWNRLPRATQESTASLWLARTGSDAVFLDQFQAFFLFDDRVQKIIHHFKYDGFRGIAHEVIKRISNEFFLYPIITTNDWIVPIPLHKKKQRKRGFNQSSLLAREIGQRVGIPCDDRCLVRVRNTRSQTRLKAMERLQNVKDAFAVRNSEQVANKKILVVDDLITTGATLNECAKALKNAGAIQVNAFCLARPQ